MSIVAANVQHRTGDEEVVFVCPWCSFDIVTNCSGRGPLHDASFCRVIGHQLIVILVDEAN